MDAQRLLDALAKAGITDIQEPSKGSRGEWRARNAAGRVLIWWDQDGTSSTRMRPQAICVHWPSPHTDTQTDCFCDTFYHTIKSAVSSLAPEHYAKKASA